VSSLAPKLTPSRSRSECETSRRILLTAKPAGRPLDSRGTPALLDTAVLLRFLSVDCSVTIHSPKFVIGPGTPVELRQYARPKEDPMLRFRKLFSFLAVAVFVVSLLSCGAHDSSEYFVFVAANLQVPYWQAAGAGFSKAAMQFKVRSDFVGPNNYDPKAERDALDQAVRQKASGILLGVTDPTLLKDSIDKAIAAGIPVITVDSDAPASKRLFFIGTNNYAAGVSGGVRLAQELNGKGNVVVFTMPDQHNMQDRLRGYRDALEHTSIKITRVVDIQGDPRIAFDTTTQIIGKENDQVDAFVSLEAQSGKEVAGVLNSYHISGKVVMAMDTDAETLDWVRKGSIAATIAQKPYTMAFVGMQMLDNLYHHKPKSLETDWSKDSFATIPSFVDTGSALIDKRNVDSFLQAKQSATGGQK
jgi:ribose transport system substrate-binding protein